MDKKPSSEAVAEYLEGRKKYEELRKQKRKKGSGREEQVKEVDPGIEIMSGNNLQYFMDVLIFLPSRQ